MRSGTRRVLSTATIFVGGLLVGAGVTGLGNAMSQHVKVAELYKADLVTSDGKEASMFLAELGPGANMGKHYHPGDAFAYIHAARNRWRPIGDAQVGTERQSPASYRSRR
jgi:hypothetical protein